MREISKASEEALKKAIAEDDGDESWADDLPEADDQPEDEDQQSDVFSPVFVGWCWVG